MTDGADHGAQAGVCIQAAEVSRVGERRFVMLFVATLLLCSLGSGKVYPFEAPSFFVASPRQYAQYTLTDPYGHPLPLHEFGLGDFYAGQAGYAVGAATQEAGALKLPPTINIFGELRTREELETAVQRALRSRSEPEYVIVSRHVVAPIEPDRRAVGIVASDHWRVAR